MSRDLLQRLLDFFWRTSQVQCKCDLIYQIRTQICTGLKKELFEVGHLNLEEILVQQEENSSIWGLVSEHCHSDSFSSYLGLFSWGHSFNRHPKKELSEVRSDDIALGAPTSISPDTNLGTVEILPLSLYPTPIREGSFNLRGLKTRCKTTLGVFDPRIPAALLYNSWREFLACSILQKI